MATSATASASTASAPASSAATATFDAMSVKELKAYLAARKVDTTDCLEKSDYIAKCKTAPSECDAKTPSAAASTADTKTSSEKKTAKVETSAAATSAAAPAVHEPESVGPYTFSGPLNSVLSGEHKNDNPYAMWEKHPSWHSSMAARLLYFHGSFRSGVKRMNASLAAIGALGAGDKSDAQWRAFTQEFAQQCHHIDGHHQIEETYVFPKLDKLCGAQPGAGPMNTPLLESQHHALLRRTSALQNMVKAVPTTDAQRKQLLADVRAEYHGWALTLQDHLRDEEKITVPLFLYFGSAFS